MSITVLITPPPTPNGPLHLGHLSGPYVAGDVAVRAARARGESVLSVSGLDVHQNYVLTAAEREGRTPAISRQRAITLDQTSRSCSV